MTDVRAVAIAASKEGAILRVKAQPGAPRSEVKGVHDGALRVAVAAPPEKGKANEALVRFLARELGLERGGLEIVSGETARDKRLLARGLDAATLEERLAKLLAAVASTGKKAKG